MLIFWSLVIGIFLFAIYFAPAFIAIGRKHNYMLQITLLNALLGWSFFGWAAALIWATTNHLDENADAKLSWVIISIFLAAMLVPILFLSSFFSFNSVETDSNGVSHSYSKSFYSQWNTDSIKKSVTDKVKNKEEDEN